MLLTYWWINHEVSFYGSEKHGLEKNSCAHMRSHASMCEDIYVALSLKTDDDKGTMLASQSIFKTSWEYKAFIKIISANNVLQKDTWFGILRLLPGSHFIYLEGMRLKMQNFAYVKTLRKIFSEAWHWDIFFMLPSVAETFAPGRVKPFARLCGWFCLGHSHVKHFRIVLFWQKQPKCDVWVHKTAFLVLRRLTWRVALGSFDPNSKLIVGVKWLRFV